MTFDLLQFITSRAQWFKPVCVADIEPESSSLFVCHYMDIGRVLHKARNQVFSDPDVFGGLAVLRD